MVIKLLVIIWIDKVFLVINEQVIAIAYKKTQVLMIRYG